MYTFYIVLIAVILMSGYIELIKLVITRKIELVAISWIVWPILLILIMFITSILLVNRDLSTRVSTTEIFPDIKEEITITNGDTIKTTKYIYQFRNE